MGLFGNKTKQLKKEILLVENNAKHSFSKVKEEMDSLQNWMNYYYQRSTYFENQFRNISSINQEMSSVLNENTDEIDRNTKLISDFADRFEDLQKSLSTLDTDQSSKYKNEINFHIEKIYSYLERMDTKIESFSYLSPTIESLKNQLKSHLQTPHSTADIERRLNLVTEKINTLILKKTPKEKLVQKVTKNRHDYIKAVLLSYIKKYEKISAFQLREMIVEEQNMTSKSTFYRLLEEIEKHEDISIIWQGKEKTYISKIKKIT